MKAIVHIIYVSIIYIFLLFPIALIVPLSFSGRRYLEFPPTQYSLRWYEDVIFSSEWQAALWNSTYVAFLAVLLAVPVGALFAAAIARGAPSISRILVVLSLTPQVIPAIILALGAFLLVNRLGLYGNSGALILVHAALGLPFVIMAVLPSYRDGVDQYIDAARSLGANYAYAYATIAVPIIRPALISSAVFVFFISFDELIVALFLMGANETLPMRMWANLKAELTPAVAAISTMLTLLTFLIVVPVEIYRRRNRKI